MFSLIGASIVTIALYGFIVAFMVVLGGGIAFKLLFSKKKEKTLSDIQKHNLKLKKEKACNIN